RKPGAQYDDARAVAHFIDLKSIRFGQLAGKIVLVDDLTDAAQLLLRAERQEAQMNGLALVKQPYAVVGTRQRLPFYLVLQRPFALLHQWRQTGHPAGYAVDSHIAQLVDDAKTFVVLVNALHDNAKL